MSKTHHSRMNLENVTSKQIPLRRPDRVRNQLVRLQTIQQQVKLEQQANDAKLKQLSDYLSISDSVTDALETLSEKLFQETLSKIEDNLSIALQEILEQPIKLVATASWKNKCAAVDFHIERDGNSEDIMKGQGGSVANILSIGLRLFALNGLEPVEHRPFLVFDEQDCWLRPDLVPRLVKIIREASRALGFQVLMISHHDHKVFEQYADRIYKLVPGNSGIAKVELVR